MLSLSIQSSNSHGNKHPNRNLLIKQSIPSNKYSPYIRDSKGNIITSKEAIFQSSKTKSSNSSSSPKSSQSNTSSNNISNLLFYFDKFITSFFFQDMNYILNDMNKIIIPLHSCISFHPNRPYLAISYDATIAIYDTSKHLFLNSLLFHEKTSLGIFCLEWSIDNDELLIGTNQGVLICKIFSLVDGNLDHIWMQHIDHPKKLPVHEIHMSPQGRYYSTITKYENVIYIHDLTFRTSTPVYCLENNAVSLHSWGPNIGRYLAFGDHVGNISVMDTYHWNHEDICLLKSPISSLCWLTCYHLLFCSQNTNLIHLMTIIPPKHDNEKISFDINPQPLVINTSNFHINELFDSQDIGIYDMITDDVSGKYIALRFMKIDDEGNIQTLPFVAVYLIHLTPTISVTLVRYVYTNT